MSNDNPIDAQYCPSCGEALPADCAELVTDLVNAHYRARFACPSCSYLGAIIRIGSEPAKGDVQRRLLSGDY